LNRLALRPDTKAAPSENGTGGLSVLLWIHSKIGDERPRIGLAGADRKPLKFFRKDTTSGSMVMTYRVMCSAKTKPVTATVEMKPPIHPDMTFPFQPRRRAAVQIAAEHRPKTRKNATKGTMRLIRKETITRSSLFSTTYRRSILPRSTLLYMVSHSTRR